MKIILPDGSVQEAEDELRAIRHTASHVLAQAVKRLYPETKLAIGPAIDDGFYYDFDREGGFTPEDRSSASRRPSPSKLSASTVSIIANPGIIHM